MHPQGENYLLSECATQIELKDFTIMADHTGESTPEYCDSSGDEFVPNSQSSDTEVEEYMTVATSTITDKSDKNVAATSEFWSANETDSASKHVRSSSRKRTNKDFGISKAKNKRGKMNRNTTHASKINCCDVEVIKNWLCKKGKECCGQNCLHKLKSLGEEAITMVAELRHRRFAGPFSHNTTKKFTT